MRLLRKFAKLGRHRLGDFFKSHPGVQFSYPIPTDEVIALRAVQTSDFMTAEWSPLPYDLLAEVSAQIVNEVRGVNRVVYDITTKPPGTIEWE